MNYYTDPMLVAAMPVAAILAKAVLTANAMAFLYLLKPRVRKIGGISFGSLGKLRFSFCIAKG